LSRVEATEVSSPHYTSTLTIASQGIRRRDLSYSYAGIITAEILAGLSSETEEFFSVLGDAMAKTRDLVINFEDHAERLIGRHVKAWGFKKQ
jgi:hypothetical protein